MNAVAIIPARGGSKRIPRKNIREFEGKPIIAYSIEAAKHSGLFDEVFVSTEDKEIKEIAHSWGAKCLDRNENLADDSTTLYEMLVESVRQLDRQYTYVACILATNPFISSSILRNGFNLLSGNVKIDSVLPVVKNHTLFTNLLCINDGLVHRIKDRVPENISQPIDNIYFDAGMFYFTKTEVLLLEQTKKITSGNVSPIILSEAQSQDINTFEDWDIAKIKFENWKKNS